MNNRLKSIGFTLIEVMAVVIVIGILTAITIVSYTGITKNANLNSIKSDLSNASDLFNFYQIKYGYFPTTLDGNNCPLTPTADTNYCVVKSSSSFTLDYKSVSPTTFRLSISDGTNNYHITDASNPTISTTDYGSTTGNPCPLNYIPVPGSGTYGTTDFCVMKYEAKILGNDVGDTVYSPALVPDSRITGTPWVSITQSNAVSESATACSGCHLITEAEWLTIAQNVLSVPSNWSTGVVGSGYIYSGYHFGMWYETTAASIDTDPYYNTGVSSGEQRRTLTLNNGQVIWDMAGNVEEWTSGTINFQAPGAPETYYSEWTAVTNAQVMTPNPSPAATGISNAGSWDSTNGVGQIYSRGSGIGTRGILRGGYWDDADVAGIFTLDFSNPSSEYSIYGFRVTR